MASSVSNILAFCPGPAPVVCHRRFTGIATPSSRVPAPCVRVSGRRPAEGRRAVKAQSGGAPAATAVAKPEVVDGKMGKSLVVDRSYTYLDVRTPEEHAEEAIFRKPPIVNVPIGFLSESGPSLNKNFVADVAKKFPNKSARILVACDDEMDRANLAAKKLAQEGYTTVRVLNGGYPEWQKVKPLTEREKPKRG
eukprot:jgi/Botrbrau1/22062/Bobra.0024s0071.1